MAYLSMEYRCRVRCVSEHHISMKLFRHLHATCSRPADSVQLRLFITHAGNILIYVHF